MGKFLIFYILYRVTGSPITALLILLAVYLAVDRAYLGFLPDPLRAFRASSRIRELKKIVSINPHDGRSLKELGIHMVERGRYQNAMQYFGMAETKMSDDPEFNYYYGISTARTGDIDKGRALLERAVNASPTLRYGEPLLMMAEVYIDNADYESALPLLEKFEKIHSSSSRGLYRMGVVHSLYKEGYPALDCFVFTRCKDKAVIRATTNFCLAAMCIFKKLELTPVNIAEVCRIALTSFDISIKINRYKFYTGRTPNMVNF